MEQLHLILDLAVWADFSRLIWLLLGTVYGFIFGLIPVAGAGTALITVFGFIDLFQGSPYDLVLFTTGIVVASTVGDSFASVVLNVPGSAGSAATMVDGFPLAKQGQSARALSAAVTTSTVNGILWGILVFFFLPAYKHVVMHFGVPEMLWFMLFAFTSVVFINSQYWFRGILSLLLGLLLGLVGEDPISGEGRFTMGWYYLQDGIQIVPVLAGIFAFPELLEAYKTSKNNTVSPDNNQSKQQIWQGVKDSWQHRRDGLRGGIIGAIVGVIPGIGGSVADWIAYGQTVASNKNEKVPFGQGNIKGIIGCEGANNAQKATSYVPTVLFGIPGAPFEVIIMALFMIVGLELGSPTLLSDNTFFIHLSMGYLMSMLLTFILAMWFIRYAARINDLHFGWYFWPIMILLLWSAGQYTGGWEDYVMLVVFCILGLILKKIKFSRPALIIGFVLSDRIDLVVRQYFSLYQWDAFLDRPIALFLFLLTIFVAIYGIFINKTRINYV